MRCQPTSSREAQRTREEPARLRQEQENHRRIYIYEGNFNEKVNQILSGRTIKEKEATFCLLDQRTFECRWATLQKLAAYKRHGTKIELFYFLANSWLERALAAQKNTAVLAAWWGRDDWIQLRKMSREERRDILVNRLKNELGYKSVKAWPIFERENGGVIMYYMIHATDHPEAPKFMSRAYRLAVMPLEPVEQFNLSLFEEPRANPLLA